MEGRLVAERYRIESVLGEGGLASVYRATDLVLDRAVAIKILHPQWADDPEAVGRFRREAHAAAKLNHPNIVQVYDTGVDGDIHYLVMEYLPELSLKKTITEYAPLPSRKALEVGIQCCRALAYIHQRGLVHRDVKPQNILFSDQGIAKLSDFGIAATVGSTGEVTSGMVLGTAHYISPEQAQGKPVGPQSDLYSLGCVIYESFTGQPPFSDETAAQIAAKHVREHPPPARALNPMVTTSEEYLISKAMAKEPSRRYRSAKEMLADLEKLAAGGELDKTGVPPVEDQATMLMQPTVQVPGKPPALVQRPARREAATDTAIIWSTVLAIIIALAALVLVGWLIKVAFYPGHVPAMVQVPSVRGLTEAEARQRLDEAQLEVGTITYEWDATAPTGRVIDQLLTEGQTVRAGTNVGLVVNLGKKIVTVPDVTGQSYYQALGQLQQVGLAAGEITEKFSDEVEEGHIIRQEIAPGTRMEEGRPVPLIVSKGPEPAVPEEPIAEEEPEEPAQALSVEPYVTITEDETAQLADTMQRRYIVKIIVMGEKLQQAIKVIKRDATGAPVIEFDEKMDPTQAEILPIVGLGNTTIQVYHAGELIQEKTFTVEPEPTADEQ